MTRVLVIDDDRLQFRLVQQHFRNFRDGAYELDWSETYEAGLARLLTAPMRSASLTTASASGTGSS